MLLNSAKIGGNQPVGNDDQHKSLVILPAIKPLIEHMKIV
ncbi:hypothetical protein L579_4460 [Pantoea sp. AS-PWVM4]|nr:hypothetical protein L579_4460 [Pantoea sp. AS-PWVM4]